jgi:tRNA(His) 5'-end guanylyltransferase
MYTIDERMKEYEKVARTNLVRRCPVIIRIDGCHFRTFTRGFDKPYDLAMSYAMEATTKYLCANIQNCVFGFTQSDEITLVLIDTNSKKPDGASPWFDNQVEKMCSVAASMATLAFNRAFAEAATEIYSNRTDWNTDEARAIYRAHQAAVEHGAMFDARCFNIPEADVINNLVWRQHDGIKNAISGLARAYFSDKELRNKNSAAKLNMLAQKDVYFDKMPTHFQRGALIVKEVYLGPNDSIRSRWTSLAETPMFKDSREFMAMLLCGLPGVISAPAELVQDKLPSCEKVTKYL